MISKVCFRALAHDYFIRSSRLKVREAYTWDQPDYEDPTTLMVSHSSDVEQDHYGTLFMLNDDCLMEIFSYVDLRDLQTLAGVCWRFKSICENMYTRYKSLDLEPYGYMPLREFHLMLHNVGTSLQSLKMSFKPEVEWLVLLAKYCKSLRSFSFEGYSTRFNVKRIRGIFRNLQRLDLIDCGLSDKCLSCLLHASRRTLETASVLEELNISRNNNLTGSALVDIVGLKAIDMNLCRQLQPEFFLKFVAKNKNLCKLSIIDCEHLDKTCIEAIASHLLELEELQVSDIYDDDYLDPLLKIQHLWCLKIDYSSSIRDKYWGTGKIGQLKHLEKLQMVSLYPIKNQDVIDIIEQCVHLKEFNVSECCIEYIGKLIQDVIIAVENKAHTLTLILRKNINSRYEVREIFIKYGITSKTYFDSIFFHCR